MRVSDQPRAGSATRDGSGLPDNPAALVRLIEQRRTHLATTVDELARRARPRELARRGASGAASRVRAATRTEDGGWRVERVVAVGVALAVVTGLLLRTRRRSR